MRLLFVTIAILCCAVCPIVEAHAQDCCLEPSFETSSNKGPATLHVSGGATVTEFQQTIGDGYGDFFDGDEVLEASRYAGVNGCYYAGAPFTSTSGTKGKSVNRRAFAITLTTVKSP
jgi:hypothetical protein